MWGPGAVALALAVSVAADVAWNFTLPNHSPTIAYEPYSDGTDPEKGWLIWTSENGYLDETAQDANGDIRHLTSHAGASFTFEFYGTAITLHGEANATYGIVLDGAGADLPSGGESILFARNNLALGMHKLKLTLKDTSRNRMVIFWDAVITSSSPTPLTTTTHPSYDPKLQYKGKWETLDIEEGRFKISASSDASVSLTFSGARAAAIHSHINWGLSVFAIMLDDILIDPPTSKKFNASSFWLVRDTIMYFADNLDPTKEHTLTLINLSTESYEYTAITNFEVWHVDPTGTATANHTESSSSVVSSTGSTSVSDNVPGGNSGSSLSPGVYAGIAIAVLAGVGAAVAIWFFFFRRKRPVIEPSVEQFDDGPASRWRNDSASAAGTATTAARTTPSMQKAGRMYGTTSPVSTSPTLPAEEDDGQLPLHRFTVPPPAYRSSTYSGGSQV